MASNNFMTFHDMVKKLVGPINPIGETRVDEERLDNLSQMIELARALISDINYVSRSKISYESSVKEAGKKADAFIAEIAEEYSDRRYPDSTITKGG